MQLTELDLTDATRGVLEKAGIVTVEELLPHRKDFTEIKFVGKGRAIEIEGALEAAEIGLATRPEPPPEEEPPPPDEALLAEEAHSEEEQAPFGGAQPGDLVIYTSEHGRRRYARLGAVNEGGSASLTIFVQGGGQYAEDRVPYSKDGGVRTWRDRGSA